MNKLFFKQFPIIETSRLVLRELQPDDAEQLFKLRSDTRVLEYMDRPKYQTIEDARKLIAKSRENFSNHTGIIWAITQKGNDILIGDLGFWRMIHENFRAEIYYELLPDKWRQGIILEAALAVIQFGFVQMNLHSIEANTNPANFPSRKLLVKLGFEQEAYFRENFYYNGKFFDSAIYSLLKP